MMSATGRPRGYGGFFGSPSEWRSCPDRLIVSIRCKKFLWSSKKPWNTKIFSFRELSHSSYSLSHFRTKIDILFKDVSQPLPTGSLLCCCKQIIEFPDDFDVLIVCDIDTFNRIIHQFFQRFIIHGACTLNDCLFLLCLVFFFEKIFIRSLCFRNLNF